MKISLFGTFGLFLFLSSFVMGTNDLTVKDNATHGSKPGYIEKATLVVEPFGSYVEQSLYLEYSERNQFSSNLLEIVHRFELPKDAVINDMWLWIGDSVMQARMFDTWTARGIYDSIVAAHYDPGFLAKNGSQYEFRIYPLAAGKIRKVKITFIVPTKWYGSQATAELPLKLLLSNNSTKKPLEILYRTQKDIWGIPTISELPGSNFVKLLDTLNYQYKHLQLNDITGYSSLNLKFNTKFTNGYYLNGYHDKSDSTYFQLGILPENFFNVKADTASTNVLVSLDFSGSFRKNLPENLPAYQSLVESSLKSNDNFKLLVSGNEKIVDFTNSFLQATPENINNIFSTFKNSDFAKGVDQIYTSNILFCDFDASTNWKFQNLSSVAHVTEFSFIDQSINSITQSDVVAAYRHGFDDPITQTVADDIIARLDSLFAGGGRFLTYFDLNRRGSEKLATHYINGLRIKANTHDAVTLYRNIEGNIGKDFPESFTRNAAYFLDYTDPDVKVELMDQSGKAAVISKKIKNGLIVVTGIWSLRDDGALKTIQGAPLLGVNSNKNPFTLPSTLKRIKEEFDSTKFAKVLLLTDSDSLISKVDAGTLATEYISSYKGVTPKFLTVNLLDNSIFTPNYISDSQVDYYGSGLFLKKLADTGNGIHLEKHLYDWSYISSVFSPNAVPILNDLKINAVVDEGAGKIFEIREIGKLADPNKPRFFLGSSSAKNQIIFNVSGRFEETNTDSSAQITFLVPHDTTSFNKIVKSMLGYENIKDLFVATPIDTASIVKLSLYHNLLTDYSALLALEPNDEYHFMKDPLDEGGFTDINEDKNVSDSTVTSVFPNPFNSMTTIRLFLNSSSNVSAEIYNILGQKVIEIVNVTNVSGEKKYFWNGNNSFGNSVNSGFYILRVVVSDSKSNKKNVYTHKLLYLK